MLGKGLEVFDAVSNVVGQEFFFSSKKWYSDGFSVYRVYSFEMKTKQLNTTTIRKSDTDLRRAKHVCLVVAEGQLKLPENADSSFVYKFKDASILKHPIYIHEWKISPNDFEVVKETDKDSIQIRWKNTVTCTVNTITVEALLTDLGLKWAIIDKSAFNKAAAIVKQAETIVKKAMSNKNYAEVVKGLAWCSKSDPTEYKSDVESFCAGNTNEFSILQYDLWDMSNNARQDNERLWNLLDQFTEYLNSLVGNNNFQFTTDGDWDTGSIDVHKK